VLFLAGTLAIPAPAAGAGGFPGEEGALCEPPISLCGPIGSRRPADSGLSCPEGYQCTCVPSCPDCEDCPVQVCVAGKDPECRTACDCEPGLACIQGTCIAGFAAVYCCDGDMCPVGAQCQHRDGRPDRCRGSCVDSYWRCDQLSGIDPCGPDRECACTSSCQLCDDCHAGVCTPPGHPPPYSCDDKGQCGAGDRCVCASSCPDCDDCLLAICVPDRCDDPLCEERAQKVSRYIERWVKRASSCRADDECVRIDTGTQCGGTCGAWVNKRHVPRLERRIEHLDHKVCDDYRADGCPYATPGCIQEVPVCMEGRCVGLAPPLTPGDAREFVPSSGLDFFEAD